MPETTFKLRARLPDTATGKDLARIFRHLATQFQNEPGNRFSLRYIFDEAGVKIGQASWKPKDGEQE